MSRFLSFGTALLAAISMTACSSGGSLWRHGESSSYANTGGGYSSGAATSGRRQQENGFKVGNPYEVMGQSFTPVESYSYDQTGIASWYGPGFHGKRTANGEPYNSGDMTAAHPTLQLPCIARVTNLDNGRSVVVRVNDRGPFKRSRLMDVSKRAAELLGMIGPGTARVRMQVLDRESRIVAEAARRGMPPQRQMALAFDAGTPTPDMAVAPPVDVASNDAFPPNNQTMNDAVAPGIAVPPTPIAQTDLADLSNQTVRKFPVHKTSLYVQAGAFGDARNAQNLAAKLGSLGPTRLSPATINGRVFSRIQIGPVASVDDADRLLSRTLAAGYPTARIVVE